MFRVFGVRFPIENIRKPDGSTKFEIVGGRVVKGFKPPKEFFHERLQRNIDNGERGKHLLRQTGKSTLNYFRVLQHLIDGKKVLIGCWTRKHGAIIVENLYHLAEKIEGVPELVPGGSWVSAPTNLCVRLPGRDQIVVDVVTDADFEAGDFLKGRNFDVLVMDDYILPPIAVSHPKFEMGMPKQKKIDMELETIVTSDKTVFKKGDLVRWGDGVAVMTRVTRDGLTTCWPTSIELLYNGEVLVVPAEISEMFEKV